MKESFTSIGTRTKWQERERNENKGEVVLVIDANTPRREWKIGWIVETYPGTNGFARVVDVKTTDGTYRRPISRIFELKKTLTLKFLTDNPMLYSKVAAIRFVFFISRAKFSFGGNPTDHLIFN